MPLYLSKAFMDDLAFISKDIKNTNPSYLCWTRAARNCMYLHLKPSKYRPFLFDGKAAIRQSYICAKLNLEAFCKVIDPTTKATKRDMP